LIPNVLDAIDMIRNYFITYKNHLLPLAIIFSLGLLPLWYSSAGLLIFGGDTGPYMLQRPNIYAWDTLNSGTGYYNPAILLGIPFQTFYSFLTAIGIPLFLSQAMLNCIWFMGAGFSMYFLAISLFNGKKLHIVATAAAIFYMFNPYNMLLWSSPDPVTLSAYASYPLLLALFARGLQSKRILRSGIFFSLGSLIFVTGNANIPFTFIMIFTLVLYFIFHLIFTSKNAKERLDALRFALIAAAMYLLVNLWWIMPLIPYYGAGIQGLAGMNPLGWLTTSSSYSSIINVIRLYGYSGWDSYTWGRPSFSYVPTLMHNSFFIAVSFLPPILFGIALILKHRIKENGIDKILLFVSLFYLLSIFLSKGVQNPFGGVYLWLFEHIPGFIVFRSGFVKFGIMIVLSSSILFGISMFILYQQIKKVRRNVLRSEHIGKVMIIAFISLILVSNYPFFTGEVIHSGEGSLPSFHHQIPSYYYEAANWINNQTGNFKLLQFYGGAGGWVVYNWGGDAFWENGVLNRSGDIYIGSDVDNLLIHKPIIHSSDSNLSNYITQLLATNSTLQIDKLLNLMNVKYTLLHNDINSAFYGHTPPEVFANGLSLQKNISLEKTFGELDLYVNEQWRDTQIYPASNPVLVNNEGGEYYTGTQLLFNDSFSRMDVNNNWITLSGNWTIKDDELSIESAGPEAWIYANTPLLKRPFTVGFEMTFLSTPEDNLGRHAGMMVNLNKVQRGASNSYGYGVQWIDAGSEYYIDRWGNGTYTALGAFPQQSKIEQGVPYHWKIVFGTANISLYVDNIFIGSVKDETYDGFYLGLWAFLNQQNVHFGNITIYHMISVDEGVKPGISFLLFPNQLTTEQLEFIKNVKNTLETPEITYTRINPTKYIVHVNASTPFFLVSSESYDNGWTASIDGQQVPNEYHFVANGFANGWYINKTGTYTITLEFLPQNLFYAGSAISITTLIICTVYISKNKIKTVYKKIRRDNSQILGANN
jgi:hypothetical protein